MDNRNTPDKFDRRSLEDKAEEQSKNCEGPLRPEKRMDSRNTPDKFDRRSCASSMANATFTWLPAHLKETHRWILPETQTARCCMAVQSAAVQESFQTSFLKPKTSRML